MAYYSHTKTESEVRKMWEKVQAVILATFFIIWTVGWAITYIGLKAILFYMKAKKYALPSWAELKKWCKYAARHSFGISEDMPD